MRRLNTYLRGLLTGTLSFKTASYLAALWVYAGRMDGRDMLIEGVLSIPKVLFDLVALAVTPGGDRE